jgi:hypothetical protein
MRQRAVTDDLDPSYLANVTRVRASGFYRDALRYAEDSPDLVAALGEPIEADLPKGGIFLLEDDPDLGNELIDEYLRIVLQRTGIDNPVGDAEKFAHVSVVLRGPKREGKLILFASGTGDDWLFHWLQVEVDGLKDGISLLPPWA